MRYIVISDIHGNAPALEAVLRDVQDADALICLGDIVGYGPNPNVCVERVQDFNLTCICGNHDQGTVGQADMMIFNRDARRALEWTQHELAKTNLDYLCTLPPEIRLAEDQRILLAHGSPRDPVWEYVVDPSAATHNFQRFSFDLLLVGHSHLPLIFEWLDDQQRVQSLRAEPEVRIRLDGRRLILNPGSVGQPRDGNPHASYAVLDTDLSTWTFHRTPYPVEITQERMRARGLPQRLIDRLEIGR